MSPHEQTPLNEEVIPPHEQAPLNEEVMPPHEQASPHPHVEPPPPSVPPQETMIQLTQEALLALIRDASTRVAAQAMTQFVAQHPINPPLLHLAEVENYPRLPRRRSRGGKRGVENPYLLLAVTPPRRSPFSPAILAEALSAGVKVSNLPEYDGTGDPQEHLDKFYAKIDCLGQLTQRFLHHFSMNKKVSKTIAYLFTVCQRENESLSDYVQRFVEAVHEVSHVNRELLANIIQQNLLPGRFKESIAEKPPNSLEDLLMRSQKYIRIEESNVSHSSLSVKRKGQEEEREPKKEERKHLAPRGFTHYTPLNALRGEILVVAEQQGLISQWPRKMQDNPKRLKSDKYYRFHREMGHTTEDVTTSKMR
ncbi:UNVERIFIED_CONTAM: hypothetical protein Slati_2573500 [Sesamum latifolium]|uniref:Retrotransposon gag domain-containing protein n=1 Tax=Sesamum latifolium TaxID=2727402 RepID=A0AAW2VWQ9_9LAMI